MKQGFCKEEYLNTRFAINLCHFNFNIKKSTLTTNQSDKCQVTKYFDQKLA